MKKKTKEALGASSCETDFYGITRPDVAARAQDSGTMKLLGARIPDFPRFFRVSRQPFGRGANHRHFRVAFLPTRNYTRELSS